MNIIIYDPLPTCQAPAGGGAPPPLPQARAVRAAGGSNIPGASGPGGPRPLCGRALIALIRKVK